VKSVKNVGGPYNGCGQQEKAQNPHGTHPSSQRYAVPKMRSKAQVLKPLMINVGSHHAPMKNNAHETSSKIYVVQDSSDLTVSLERLNSAAAISQAISGSPVPMINSLIDNWIARVKCIATSAVWLLVAAIKIKHAKSPSALRKISAMVNLCPIRFFLVKLLAGLRS
jgi:hypothetical protein